jgi:dihydroxyacetone kinase
MVAQLVRRAVKVRKVRKAIKVRRAVKVHPAHQAVKAQLAVKVHKVLLVSGRKVCRDQWVHRVLKVQSVQRL